MTRILKLNIDVILFLGEDERQRRKFVEDIDLRAFRNASHPSYRDHVPSHKNFSARFY